MNTSSKRKIRTPSHCADQTCSHADEYQQQEEDPHHGRTLGNRTSHGKRAMEYSSTDLG